MKTTFISSFNNFKQHTLKKNDFGKKEFSFKSLLTDTKLKDTQMVKSDEAVLSDKTSLTTGQKLNFLA